MQDRNLRAFDPQPNQAIIKSVNVIYNKSIFWRFNSFCQRRLPAHIPCCRMPQNNNYFAKEKTHVPLISKTSETFYWPELFLLVVAKCQDWSLSILIPNLSSAVNKRKGREHCNRVTLLVKQDSGCKVSKMLCSQRSVAKSLVRVWHLARVCAFELPCQEDALRLKRTWQRILQITNRQTAKTNIRKF